MQVLDFAAGRAKHRPAPPLATARPCDRTVHLFYIAGRLGRRDATIRTLVKLIRGLTDQRGFPAPLGGRVVKGTVLTGPDAVTATARWQRAAVDAWFDDGLPQTIRHQLDAARQSAIDAQLDANAARLCGGRA